MIKAIFFAANAQQADYWARQWGYHPREWEFITTTGNWQPKVFGRYNPDIPAFICGTEGFGPELRDELEARKFTVYEAEDLKAS